MAGNGSGDIFLAFSTANVGAARKEGIVTLTMLPNEQMNALFDATVQATEEASMTSRGRPWRSSNAPAMGLTTMPGIRLKKLTAPASGAER